MYKLWMHASANLRKTKSVSVTLAIIFVIAALLLNAGLLVVINYGNYFDTLKEELLPADAYYMIPDALYTDEVKTYLNNNEHIQKKLTVDVRWLSAQISYKGKDQSFNILFTDMDEPRDMCKWKYVGDPLPADEMSVYVPDIFQAVGGYRLNDTIDLKYYDPVTDAEKTLAFTVKGYTEDIFFSSTDTGFIAFYLSSAAFEKVSEILRDPVNQAHVVFADVDDAKNVTDIESGIRETLGINSASLVAVDPSSLLVSIDLSLIELSRCMMASMVSAMMVVFALVIVIVCLLVVRFRIVNSIEDDVVKMGSLQAVGYTSRQIILSIALQFLLIAGVGSLVGIALSYLVLPFVAAVFEQQSGLKWEQGFDGAVSTAAFGVVMIIVALAAWLAARRVSKINPVNALRAETSSRKYRKNRLPLDKTRGRLSVLLAFKSILQGIKQPVMIFIILTAVSFAGAYGMIMYYNTSVDTKAFAEVPGMEVCNVIAVLNPEGEKTQAAQSIAGMANVRKTQYLDEVKLKVDGNEASAFVMDDYALKESVMVYEGCYPQHDNEIALAGILAERLHKTVGDTVKVAYGNRSEVFRVVGLTNGSSMGGLNTSILTQDFLRLNPDFQQQALYIYLDRGSDAAEFILKLKDQLDQKTLLGTTNFDKEMADGMASYQNIVAAMGLIMLVITILVVSLVLYFLISSSVIRRKRELGIQKAIGFTTFQLMNQISLGFMAPIILGAVVGSFLGAFYTNPLMSVVMKGMGVMKARFIVDPLWVTAFGVATIVFSYLLSLLVSWRIRKISAYALVTE